MSMKYLKVWTSLLEIILQLKDDEIGRLFVMMLKYADAKEEPQDDEFIGNERFLWPVVKRDIDMAEERNEKLRANASKGGIAKRRNKQALANDSKIYQELAKDSNDYQTEANVSSKGKERKEKKGNEKESNSSSKNIVTLKRFVPPTVEEIKAYCDERGVYLIDPQQFIDYYEARGWMLGKNRKMVDWKAAVRTWEKNERERMKERFADDIPY